MHTKSLIVLIIASIVQLSLAKKDYFIFENLKIDADLLDSLNGSIFKIMF